MPDGATLSAVGHGTPAERRRADRLGLQHVPQRSSGRAICAPVWGRMGRMAGTDETGPGGSVRAGVEEECGTVVGEQGEVLAVEADGELTRQGIA